ncbi:hypothetical protein TCAL_14491 [Tigriopus californicus]|uniref:CUB domain-containing protein n=1 Tax=Tigriopus californicus TaxID=6832 RepID=A0A553PU27_TIGCA|nr:hypothetical protein TCAL_14491 [Tigriopus californicus]
MEKAPGANLPSICGSNTGQHMYIDIGKTAMNTAMINFMFMAPAMGATMGMTSMRTWDIKVTQFKFSDPGNPPPGCLQYHSGMAGRIRTFNYDAMASTHIASQNYQVCIRQEPGYSCIQYTVCADMTGFTLDVATIAGAAVDTGCTSDFIEISGSSALCNQGTLTSRYCGTNLNTAAMAMADTSICDCTAPFRVGIFTDKMADTGVAAMPASKGLCLEYKQLP